MSKYIELTQGKVAIVDDEDFELVSRCKWHTLKRNNIFYAIYGYYDKQTKKVKHILMHRLIMKINNNDIIIDHIDRNGLNNQRSNLRICNLTQNQGNRKSNKSSLSKYKGVYWNKRDNKWVAQIGVNGKRKHLGYFKIEEEAAKTYDAAAKKYFGEFARLNINGQ